MKKTKFFTKDWKETTPNKAYYSCMLIWDKEGKLLSSTTGIRHNSSGKIEDVRTEEEKPTKDSERD